jgi:hypothetical protein
MMGFRRFTFDFCHLPFAFCLAVNRHLKQSLALTLVASMILTMPGTTGWAGGSLPQGATIGNNAPDQSQKPIVPATVANNQTTKNIPSNGQEALGLANMAGGFAAMAGGSGPAYTDAVYAGAVHDVTPTVQNNIIGYFPDGRAVTAADIAPGGQYAFGVDWNAMDAQMMQNSMMMMRANNANDLINQMTQANQEAEFASNEADYLQSLCKTFNCQDGTGAQLTIENMQKQLDALALEYQNVIYAANSVWVYFKARSTIFSNYLNKKYGDPLNSKDPSNQLFTQNGYGTVGLSTFIHNLENNRLQLRSELLSGDKTQADLAQQKMIAINRILCGASDPLCTQYGGIGQIKVNFTSPLTISGKSPQIPSWQQPGAGKVGLYSLESDFKQQQSAADQNLKTIEQFFLGAINTDLGSNQIITSDTNLQNKIKSALDSTYDPMDKSKDPKIILRKDALQSEIGLMSQPAKPSQPTPSGQAGQASQTGAPTPAPKSNLSAMAFQAQKWEDDLAKLNLATTNKPLNVLTIAKNAQGYGDITLPARQMYDKLTAAATKDQKAFDDQMMVPYKDQADQSAYKHTLDILAVYKRVSDLKQQFQTRIDNFDKLAADLKKSGDPNALTAALAKMMCGTDTSASCTFNNIKLMNQEFVQGADGNTYFNSKYIPPENRQLAFNVYGTIYEYGGMDAWNEYQKYQMATFTGDVTPEMIKNGFQHYDLSTLNPDLYNQWFYANYDPTIKGDLANAFDSLDNKWRQIQTDQQTAVNNAQTLMVTADRALNTLRDTVGMDWLTYTAQVPPGLQLPVPPATTSPSPVFDLNYKLGMAAKDILEQTWENMEEHPWNTLAGVGGVLVGAALTLGSGGMLGEIGVPLMYAGGGLALGVGITGTAIENGFVVGDKENGGSFSWSGAGAGAWSGLKSGFSGFLIGTTAPLLLGGGVEAGAGAAAADLTATNALGNIALKVGSGIGTGVRWTADLLGISGGAITDLSAGFAAVDAKVALAGGSEVLTYLNAGTALAKAAEAAPAIESAFPAITSAIGDAYTASQAYLAPKFAAIGDQISAGWKAFETANPLTAEFLTDVGSGALSTARAVGTYLDYAVPASLSLYGLGTMGNGSISVKGTLGALTSPVSFAAGLITYGIGGAVSAFGGPGLELRAAGLQAMLNNDTASALMGDNYSVIHSVASWLDPAAVDYADNLKLADQGTPLQMGTEHTKPGWSQDALNNLQKIGYFGDIKGWSAAQKTFDDIAFASGSTVAELVVGTAKVLTTAADVAAFGIGSKIAGLTASNLLGLSKDIQTGGLTASNLVGTRTTVAQLASMGAMQAPMLDFYKEQMGNFDKLVNPNNPLYKTYSMGRYIYDTATFALGVAGAHYFSPAPVAGADSPEGGSAPETQNIFLKTAGKESFKMVAMGAAGYALAPFGLAVAIPYLGAFGLPLYQVGDQAYLTQLRAQGAAAIQALGSPDLNLSPVERQALVNNIINNTEVTKSGNTLYINGVQVPEALYSTVRPIFDAQQDPASVAQRLPVPAQTGETGSSAGIAKGTQFQMDGQTYRVAQQVAPDSYSVERYNAKLDTWEATPDNVKGGVIQPAVLSPAQVALTMPAADNLPPAPADIPRAGTDGAAPRADLAGVHPDAQPPVPAPAPAPADVATLVPEVPKEASVPGSNEITSNPVSSPAGPPVGTVVTQAESLAGTVLSATLDTALRPMGITRGTEAPPVNFVSGTQDFAGTGTSGLFRLTSTLDTGGAKPGTMAPLTTVVLSSLQTGDVVVDGQGTHWIVNEDGSFSAPGDRTAATPADRLTVISGAKGILPGNPDGTGTGDLVPVQAFAQSRTGIPGPSNMTSVGTIATQVESAFGSGLDAVMRSMGLAPAAETPPPSNNVSGTQDVAGTDVSGVVHQTFTLDTGGAKPGTMTPLTTVVLSSLQTGDVVVDGQGTHWIVNEDGSFSAPGDRTAVTQADRLNIVSNAEGISPGNSIGIGTGTGDLVPVQAFAQSRTGISGPSNMTPVGTIATQVESAFGSGLDAVMRSMGFTRELGTASTAAGTTDLSAATAAGRQNNISFGATEVHDFQEAPNGTITGRMTIAGQTRGASPETATDQNTATIRLSFSSDSGRLAPSAPPAEGDLGNGVFRAGDGPRSPSGDGVNLVEAGGLHFDSGEDGDLVLQPVAGAKGPSIAAPARVGSVDEAEQSGFRDVGTFREAVGITLEAAREAGFMQPGADAAEHADAASFVEEGVADGNPAEFVRGVLQQAADDAPGAETIAGKTVDVVAEATRIVTDTPLQRASEDFADARISEADTLIQEGKGCSDSKSPFGPLDHCEGCEEGASSPFKARLAAMDRAKIALELPEVKKAIEDYKAGNMTLDEVVDIVAKAAHLTPDMIDPVEKIPDWRLEVNGRAAQEGWREVAKSLPKGQREIFEAIANDRIPDVIRAARPSVDLKLAEDLRVQSRELRVQELMARISGDTDQAARIVAARDALQSRTEVQAQTGRIGQIENLRDDASGNYALVDELKEANDRVAKEWKSKLDNLTKAKETAESVKEQEEADRIEGLIKAHQAELEDLPRKAELEALEAMDRHAAEREILAQRAENLANGGKDWSTAEIERRTAELANEYTRQRKDSIDPNKPIENSDSVRARIDQASKDAQALRDIAGRQSRLYEEQAKALKNAEEATSSSKSREFRAEAKAKGEEITRLKLDVQSQIAARTIAQLESRQLGRMVQTAENLRPGRAIEESRRGASDTGLSPADAYQLAKARYDQAVAERQLKLMDAGGSARERAGVLSEYRDKLNTLQQEVKKAWVAEQVDKIQGDINKIGEGLNKQVDRIAKLQESQKALESVFKQIQDRIDDLTKRAANETDPKVLEDLAVEGRALTKYADSLAKDLGAQNESGEFKEPPKQINDTKLEEFKETERKDLQRQVESAAAKKLTLPPPDPSILSSKLKGVRDAVEGLIKEAKQARSGLEAMSKLAEAQRDVELADTKFSQRAAAKNLDNALKNFLKTFDSDVNEAVKHLDKTSQEIANKNKRSQQEAEVLAQGIYNALRKLYNDRAQAALKDLESGKVDTQYKNYVTKDGNGNWVAKSFTFIGQDRSGDGTDFAGTGQYRGLVALLTNKSFNLATSGGKTLIAALFSALQKGQVVFVAPTPALAMQLETKDVSGGITLKEIIQSVGSLATEDGKAKTVYNIDTLYKNYDDPTNVGGRKALYSALEDPNGVLLMSRETHGFLFLKTQMDGALRDSWNYLQGNTPISLLADEVQNLATPMSFIMSNASGQTLEAGSSAWLKAQAMARLFDSEANNFEVIPSGEEGGLGRFWALDGAGVKAYWYDSQTQTTYLTDAAVKYISDKAGMKLSTSDIVSFAKGWGQSEFNENHSPVGAVVEEMTAGSDDYKVIPVNAKGEKQGNMTYHDTIYAAAFAIYARESLARADMVPVSKTNMQVAESQAMNRYTSILGMTGTSEGVRALLANKIGLDVVDLSVAPDRILSSPVRFYKSGEPINMSAVADGIVKFLAQPATLTDDGRVGLRRALVYGLNEGEREALMQAINQARADANLPKVNSENVESSDIANKERNLEVTGADYYGTPEAGKPAPARPAEIVFLMDDAAIEGTDWRGDNRLVGNLSSLLEGGKGASAYLQFINRVERAYDGGNFAAERDLWVTQDGVTSALDRLANSPAQRDTLMNSLWGGENRFKDTFAKLDPMNDAALIKRIQDLYDQFSANHDVFNYDKDLTDAENKIRSENRDDLAKYVKGVAQINGKAFDLPDLLTAFKESGFSVKGLVDPTSHDADALTALALNYVEARISTTGHQGEAREANVRAMNLEPLQARYQDAVVRENRLSDVYKLTNADVVKQALDQATKWREAVENAIQKATNPSSRDANYKPENKATTVEDTLKNGFEGDRANSLKMWEQLRNQLPSDSTFDGTRAKIDQTIAEITGTKWKDISVKDGMRAVDVLTVADAVAYNKQLAKEMLPFESAENPLVSKVLQTANALSNKIRPDSPAPGDSGGDAGSDGGSGGGRPVDRGGPGGPSGSDGRGGGPDTNSGRPEDNPRDTTSRPTTIPVMAFAGQPAMNAQAAVGLVEPAGQIPVNVGSAQVLPPAPVPQTQPMATRSLTIPELYTLRAQAIEAVQRTNDIVPALVASIAGAKSLSQVAQLIYDNAGLLPPAKTSLGLGNPAQWWTAILGSKDSMSGRALQTFSRATQQTASKGWTYVKYGPLSLTAGVKAVGGAFLIAASPLIGAVAAVMPLRIKPAQRVSLLVAAASSNLKNVIPILKSLAASQPDVVSAALTDQAIEAAGNRSGARKDEVVQTLKNLRSSILLTQRTDSTAPVEKETGYMARTEIAKDGTVKSDVELDGQEAGIGRALQALHNVAVRGGTLVIRLAGQIPAEWHQFLVAQAQSLTANRPVEIHIANSQTDQILTSKGKSIEVSGTLMVKDGVVQDGTLPQVSRMPVRSLVATIGSIFSTSDGGRHGLQVEKVLTLQSEAQTKRDAMLKLLNSKDEKAKNQARVEFARANAAFEAAKDELVQTALMLKPAVDQDLYKVAAQEPRVAQLVNDLVQASQELGKSTPTPDAAKDQRAALLEMLHGKQDAVTRALATYQEAGKAEKQKAADLAELPDGKPIASNTVFINLPENLNTRDLAKAAIANVIKGEINDRAPWIHLPSETASNATGAWLMQLFDEGAKEEGVYPETVGDIINLLDAVMLKAAQQDPGSLAAQAYFNGLKDKFTESLKNIKFTELVNQQIAAQAKDAGDRPVVVIVPDTVAKATLEEMRGLMPSVKFIQAWSRKSYEGSIKAANAEAQETAITALGSLGSRLPFAERYPSFKRNTAALVAALASVLIIVALGPVMAPWLVSAAALGGVKAALMTSLIYAGMSMPGTILGKVISRWMGVKAGTPTGKLEMFGGLGVTGLGIGLAFAGPIAHAAPVVRMLATQILNLVFRGALVGLGLKEYLRIKNDMEAQTSPDVATAFSSKIAAMIPRGTVARVGKVGILGAVTASAAQAFTGGSTAGAVSPLLTIGVWAAGLAAVGYGLYQTHLWAQRHLPRYNTLFGTNA